MKERNVFTIHIYKCIRALVFLYVVLSICVYGTHLRLLFSVSLPLALSLSFHSHILDLNASNKKN